ncbi:MAG: LamG-like jellyroll fold domain-containing protein [Planctomycetota bacterium]|jgi:tetratricopeptide (TPR) repeat protein
MKKRMGKCVAWVLAVTMGLSLAAAHGGLVGHWELDETSGTTVKDSTGNGHDGILTGGLSFDNRSVAGEIGNALHLDGTQDRRIFVESIDLPASAFTIGLWFNPDLTLDGSSERVYFMFWQGGRGNREGDKPLFVFNKKSDGRIQLFVNIAGQAEQEMATETTSWKASTWHHIAVTFDGADFKLYVNGVEETAARHPGRHHASSKAYFGGRMDGRYCLRGKLDDIRIYDYALSAEEVIELKWANPTLKEFVDALAEAETMINRKPKEAVVLIQKKIAELEQQKKEWAGKYPLISRPLFFDLFFSLARAKEAAGMSKDDIYAAYQSAQQHGLPSRANTASVLLWLFEKGKTEQYKHVVGSLNDNKGDYLKDVTGTAERMLAEGKNSAVSKFLESNIAAYSDWQQKHPFDDVPAESVLPIVYFQLARAAQAAGAAKQDIVLAYSQTFDFSDHDCVSERTAALAWLLDNECVKEYQQIIKSFAQSRDIVEPLAGVVLNISKECESKNDWPQFQRLLDALFLQAKYPSEWVLFVESSLGGKTSEWAEKYSEYIETRPALKFDRDRAMAVRYVAESKYRDAAELYRDLLNRCESADDRRTCEFEGYRCMFLGGEYPEVIPGIESFIAANKSANRSQVMEAMLMKTRACVQLGEFDKAVDTCFTLMMEYPEMKEMPEVSFFMGYCNMLQGDFDKAVEALNIVVQHYPESDFADKARMCLTRIKNITQ